MSRSQKAGAPGISYELLERVTQESGPLAPSVRPPSSR